MAWPAGEKIETFEIACLADPLIGQNPQWGSYVGVSQSLVKDGDINNHLSLDLADMESVQKLIEFCEQQKYHDAVVLIHSDRDKLFSPRIEEIVGHFPEVCDGI